jgi:rubrerythrin
VSIETSYGFRSAQAAYDNATPYDDECTCTEAEWFICEDCGEENPDASNPGDCPLCDGFTRLMTDEETVENHAKLGCPAHGGCGGCSSRYCEDCNG